MNIDMEMRFGSGSNELIFFVNGKKVRNRLMANLNSQIFQSSFVI